VLRVALGRPAGYSHGERVEGYEIHHGAGGGDRRQWLVHGRARGRGRVCFAAARQAQFDQLADAVEAHLDTAALGQLISAGPAPGLPGLPPGADG
jgi:adenosylcobyric acid synthase